MRQVVLRIGFLSLLFTSCGGDPAVPSGINPSQSDSPPVSGSYSLKSSDCKTTSSPLLIGQNLGVLTFRGGFDYGVSEWTGYVLSSDKKIYFTIPGTTETLTCQATLTDTELEGSCSLTSGGSCSFSFTRTGDIPPAGQDQDGDGVPDNKDNCPTVVNGEQGDIDGDGVGDLCDELREGVALFGRVEGQTLEFQTEEVTFMAVVTDINDNELFDADEPLRVEINVRTTLDHPHRFIHFSVGFDDALALIEGEMADPDSGFLFFRTDNGEVFSPGASTGTVVFTALTQPGSGEPTKGIFHVIFEGEGNEMWGRFEAVPEFEFLDW